MQDANLMNGEDEEDYYNEYDEEEDEGADADEEEEARRVAITKVGNKYPEFAVAAELLDLLKAKYPQFGIDGERNIWIVKPAGSSRGRGIVLYRNLVQILDICKQKET